MTREQWLSLGLKEAARPVFEAGNLRTIEAAGTALSNEASMVIATILRLFSPS